MTLRLFVHVKQESAMRRTESILSALAAAMAVLAVSAPAEAGSRSLGGNQTFVSCQITCVKSVDGRQAQNYRICVNNLTGQTVSITPAPSRRFCHPFP
jgi:hypothetical protein